MIGGGSGRSAGAFTAAGALATTGAFVTAGAAFATAGAFAALGASGARTVSGARGEASPLTRRRSIAARARSLASRRSSGAAAVSTGAAGAAATTGAAEEFRGCTGDASMTRIFSFSRGAAAWRRWSASAGLSADFTSDLASERLGVWRLGVEPWRQTWCRLWRQPLLRFSRQLLRQLFPGPFQPPPAVRQRSSP